MSKAPIRQQSFGETTAPDEMHTARPAKEGKYKFTFYMSAALRDALHEMALHERISVQKIMENAVDAHFVKKGRPRLAELDPKAAPKAGKAGG